LNFHVLGQWCTTDSDPAAATSTDYTNFRWTDIYLPAHATWWRCSTSATHRYLKACVNKNTPFCINIRVLFSQTSTCWDINSLEIISFWEAHSHPSSQTPHLIWNCRVAKGLLLDPILSQINPFHILTLLFGDYFNVSYYAVLMSVTVSETKDTLEWYVCVESSRLIFDFNQCWNILGSKHFWGASNPCDSLLCTVQWSVHYLPTSTYRTARQHMDYLPPQKIFYSTTSFPRITLYIMTPAIQQYTQMSASSSLWIYSFNLNSTRRIWPNLNLLCFNVIGLQYCH
jgi:hypothetical protein